ncbi:hypothetical protein K7432_016672, partial [Basidiobolus ranarum]
LLLPGESMLSRHPSSPNSSSTGHSSPSPFPSPYLSHVMSRRPTTTALMKRERPSKVS